MRRRNIERVKRRLLQEAVAENVAMIHGLPPRALRPATRLARIWLRRSALVLLPLAFAGSSYMMSSGDAQHRASAPVATAQAAALASREPRDTTRIEPGVAPAERLAATAFPLAVRRVVIDAGHGGSDPGATAAELFEKEITLDIGRRLRTLLERDGFDVVVTRDRDETVALRDRAHLANASRGDIFISIHVNAIVKHTESRGIETYYLGTTNDPTLAKLAAVENRVSGYSVADMRTLLDRVYADARRDESQALARTIQRHLFSALRTTDPGLEDWGVKRAPFLVLVATDMPAALAEVGCISNEKEAALLRRPEYRQQIAGALLDGIRAYAGAADTLQTHAPQKKGTSENG